MTQQSSFDDAEAKRIIARAAEIDARQRQSLDANALRDIAAEAGISPASVDKALEEHLRPPTTMKARLIRRPGLIVGALLLALLFLMRLFP
jgi:hypothetical protein